MPARPPSRGETSATLRSVGSRRRQPTAPERHKRRVAAGHRRPYSPSRAVTDGEYDASPVEDTHQASRSGRPNSHVPVRVSLCHVVSDDVNVVLLQHTPNLLNILHIHAGNADAALDLAVTVLNDFKLKRDAVQTKNDLPAQ